MRCFGPSGQLLRFTPRRAARSSSGSSMKRRLLPRQLQRLHSMQPTSLSP
jgi:hypothetical protein